MSAKTPYNHGGRFMHAGTCAEEAFEVSCKKFDEMKAAYRGFDLSKPGDANRFNDYVRELKGFVGNLETFLEHSGSATGGAA
ncbi:hypothetical protein [Phyllobacterium chamaecytisi]|uniref:hypothetical protein n=1 Tax=Phyllobacterium chamaecytisi TaxID=2876082 RepID=UPI001CCD191F|nr:hypothetical protein [Phyllobacterium sp. KW56]MBZ9600710.1 hypothetical protein [Phyllobacterium sp. KW56]